MVNDERAPRRRDIIPVFVINDLDVCRKGYGMRVLVGCPEDPHVLDAVGEREGAQLRIAREFPFVEHIRQDLGEELIGKIGRFGLLILIQHTTISPSGSFKLIPGRAQEPLGPISHKEPHDVVCLGLVEVLVGWVAVDSVPIGTDQSPLRVKERLVNAVTSQDLAQKVDLAKDDASSSGPTRMVFIFIQGALIWWVSMETDHIEIFAPAVP
jgi:hypothetical protein